MSNKQRKQKKQQDAIPDQSEGSKQAKKIEKENDKKAKADYKIYPPRKEEDFVKIDRELHPFYASMFSKNGAVLQIAAPPGSGKTSFISNLLGREEYFKDLFEAGVFVCSPTIHNDIGASVIRSCADHMEDDYSEEYAKNIFRILTGGEDDGEESDDENNGLSCILFDDCMGSFKQNTFVGRLCSMCRHLKSLIIFSNQRVVGIPSNIRANISHSVVYNQPSQKEFAALVDLHSAFGGEDNFIEHYNDACSVRYGALLCDFREMKMYKQIPETGEILEVYSRYNEDGSIADNKKMTKEGMKSASATEVRPDKKNDI